MSFTLTHYKDGVPRPIKMSIWDAFRGVPDPKPKPKLLNMSQANAHQGSYYKSTSMEPCKELANHLMQCSCCHKVHLPNRPEDKKDSDKKKGSGKGETGGKDKKKDESQGAKNDSKDTKDTNFSTREEETYSKEDDEKIIELKQQQTNWKDILEAIDKKSVSQLKAHWKEIDPNREGQATGKDESNANDKSKSKESKKDEKKNDGQSKKDKQEGKGKNKPGSKKDSNNSPEAADMKSWSDRYDRQKWVAAASRHFDLTGQRITPEAAKKLAEG